MPITPGSTGVPSIRWWSRKAWRVGSSSVSTLNPSLEPSTPASLRSSGRAWASSASSRPRGRARRWRWRSSSITRAPRRPGPRRPGRPPSARGAPRHAVARRQHVDAGHLHHLRDRAAGGHADPGPRGPVDRDAARLARAAEAGDALAQQVVGGGCSPSGRRCRSGPAIELKTTALPTSTSAERAQQVEPAVGLDVEDQVELGLRLVGQEVADLQPGAVEQRVDAAAVSSTGRDAASRPAPASVRSTWCQ